ncbi:uncharacterized protein LOC101772266 [Setaria italica]|uniref:uncharacterized protein LOC101772266 n=1 Tax=Setaria italica TaxID=4555 RepID=UPI0003513003|nr:uncharacterized protein LOC101772266 [Setaria italica]
MPFEVTWDEEMLDDIDTHEGLLQQLALGVDGENTKGFAHVLLDGMSSQDVAQEVCEEILGKVVWDEEMPAELDMNNKILQLLASDGGYPDDEQVVDGSLGIMEFGLIDADHVFVEEIDEDSKTVCEEGMDDELTLERNTPFLMGFCMDHVNEMPVNVDSHDGLSQQLASGREYVSDEKMKPTIELDFGLSPPISIQEEMGIGSFVRVPEQGLILKIGRHRFGQGNGTIIVLEEMTTLLELYKLKDFYLLVIVANKLVYMPRKGIAKDMLEEPLRYWTKSHADCLMKSQTPMSYELCHGK